MLYTVVTYIYPVLGVLQTYQKIVSDGEGNDTVTTVI